MTPRTKRTHITVIESCFVCRDSYWPSGILAEASPERKKDVKIRTRVAAKTKMFGSIPGRILRRSQFLLLFMS